MTRRGPKSDAAAVSLFPFLAVLLCTMGALIVLLVMLSLQAKETRVTEAPPAPPAVDEEALARYQSLRQRADELNAQRAQLAAALDQRAEALRNIQVQGTRMEEELESLSALRGQLRANEDSDVTEEQLKANLVWYENKLLEKETELKRIRAQAAANPVSYAIVPYTGESGTFRRPLYIECTEEGVILQPEGVILRADDFEILAANNPLVSALRETTDYWRGQGRSARGEAYPLLLVRPDGALAFHAAKTALEYWSGDFGYEFVDQDWNLEFSQPDSELARRQAQAIDNARNLLANLRRGGSGLLAQATRPSFRVGTQGGLEEVSPGSSNSGGRRGNGQSSSGQGTSSGAATNAGNANGTGFSSGGTGRNGTATGGAENNGAGNGTGQNGDRYGANGTGGAGTDRSGSGGTNGTGGGNPFMQGAPGGTDANGNPLAGGAGGSQMGDGQLGNGQYGGGQNGLAVGGNGQSQFGGGADGQGTQMFGGGGNGPRDPLAPMFAGANGQGGAGQGGTGQGGLQGSGQSGGGEPGSGQAGLGQFGGHEPNPVTGGAVPRSNGDGTTNYVGMANPANDTQWRQGGAAGGSQPFGATGQANGAMADNGNGSGSLTNDVTSSGTPQLPGSFGQPSSGFGSGSSNGGSGAQQSGSGASGAGQQPGGLGSFSFGGSGANGGNGGAAGREENWALPHVGVGDVPVSRTMRVTLDAQTLTVYSKDPQWKPEAVQLRPNTSESLDDFRMAVWREMDRWGSAGRGMYWRPILKIDVTPDGADRYFELKGLMENSGFVLESQRVFADSQQQPPRQPQQQQPPQQTGPLLIRPAANPYPPRGGINR